MAFFPSQSFGSWLVSAGAQCQEYPFLTATTVPLILEAPVQMPIVWQPPTVACFLFMYGTLAGFPNTAHLTFLASWIGGSQWSKFEVRPLFTRSTQHPHTYY